MPSRRRPEIRLCSAQGHQPASDFARDKRFQPGSYQRTRFLNSSQQPGFLDEAVVNI
jgi:ribulose bisphosphate carboxylase small subunit